MLTKNSNYFLADQQLVYQLQSKLSKNSQILTPTHPSWTPALRSFNLDAESQTPSLYVKCSTQSDISECLKFAQANNLPVTPRSGCHNLGNFSLIQGGLVIDVKLLNGVWHRDLEGGVGKVVVYQTGCRFGEVDQYVMGKLPGYAFVGAMDPSIGTGGARSALGVGWLQRLVGNGIDNIVSARIVLANGDIVNASQEENTDLLKAIKGAASNFGIVTQITQKLHYIVDPLQRKQILYSAHFYQISQAQSVYNQIYNLYYNYNESQSFPDQVFILPVIHFVNEKRGLSIFSCHFRYNSALQQIDEKQSEVQRRLKKIQKEFNGLAINHLGDADGWGFISYQTLQKKAMNIPWGSGFYPCGGFVSYQNSKKVTSELISHWKDSDIPQFSKKVPFHSTAFYHFGGKAQRSRDPTKSAWPGNSQTFLLTVTWGGWQTPQQKPQMISWVKDQWKSLYKQLQFGYLCAAAFDWKSTSYSKFVYGSNYDELVKIKSKYDPHNIFRHNVNIKPN